MKVRIIQSIDIGEVPSKLHELIDSAFHNMHEVQNLVSDCLAISEMRSASPLKYDLLKQGINNLRTEMASIDQELSDVDSILEGYMGIIKEPETPPVPQAPAPVSAQPETKVGDNNVNEG